MSAEPESRTHALFEELKRRRVIRVATLYIIALWPVIQIADILSPAIGLPDAAMRLMLITFAAGLPVALMLAWLFDLNRGGIVRTDAEDARLHDKPLIGRSAELVVIVVMLCAIAGLFYVQRNDLFWDEPVATNVTPAAEIYAAPAPIPVTPPASAKAIAVLPFVSFSEQREDQLFTDGLTEELLNVLSRVRDLQVIARTTSFAYKGVNKNVQEIGRELNVGTIIEGSVRRNDVENAIRVTAQLIDVTTGVHLWSETFDREFRDIFKIQDEIAGAVAQQLQVTLDKTARTASAQPDNIDPQAMVAFSMGRSALGRRTRDGLTDAEGHFQRAIEANPNYVAAYAQLGIVYALLADREPASRDDYLRRAQAQIDTAVQLDENSGVAWAAQGLVHMQRANKTEAKTALRKAIDMQPSLAMAHMWIGNLAADPTERRRFHARAFELDPRSPVAGYNLARDLLEEGREAESFEIFSKIVEADPHYPGAYQLLAQSSEHRGRLDEALRSYAQVFEMSPSAHVATRLAALWIDIGDFERADEWIARAGDLVPPDQANEVAWLKVASYVARGDRPTAEALLAPLAERDSMHPNGHLNATLANYFLGDFQRTVTAYERARTLSNGAVDQLIDAGEAQIAAAFAYGELGRDEDKTKTLALADAQITRELGSGRRVRPDLWYWRALIDAIRGDHAQAITHLQRAVDEGWRQHWRPQVEPCLTELAKLPVFTAMMQGLATRMDVIREQIAFDAEFDEGWNS